MRASCCDKLAVLEGVPNIYSLTPRRYATLGAGEPPGPPPGLSDWKNKVAETSTAILKESDTIQAGVLNTALAIATAALPIPVVGWIVAGVTLVSSFLGVNIRGRTQHVPRYPDAHNAGQVWAEKQYAMYISLPNDARVYMIDKTYEFNVYQYNVFGQWWGGVFIRDFGVPGTLDQFRRIDPRLAIYGVNGAWIEIIMASADKDSVGENMKTWFFDNYERIVLKPLDGYMLEKYNQTIDQYIKAGGKLLTAGASGAAGMFLIAALIGAVFIAQPKPKRGRQ